MCVCVCVGRVATIINPWCAWIVRVTVVGSVCNQQLTSGASLCPKKTIPRTQWATKVKNCVCDGFISEIYLPLSAYPCSRPFLCRNHAYVLECIPTRSVDKNAIYVPRVLHLSAFIYIPVMQVGMYTDNDISIS